MSILLKKQDGSPKKCSHNWKECFIETFGYTNWCNKCGGLRYTPTGPGCDGKIGIRYMYPKCRIK